MANRRRWCFYIPLASLVCMVIWYSIPFTIESTNRNPVDIKSIKTEIIYKSKQVSVPTVSKQNVVPTVSKQNVVPTVSKKNAVPTVSKQNAVPTVSKQNVVPTVSKQNVVPTVSKQNVVPTVSKQNVVPTVSKQNVVPTVSKQNVVPTVSKMNVVPTVNKNNVVPTVSNQNVTLTVGKVNKINEKYLVFLCDEKRDCGGWGDRQRGIVSLFLLSLVWKRSFKIVISSPCDIKPYYKPTKEYNWIFTEEELKGLKNKKTTTLDYMGVDEPLININLNSTEIAEVLYIKTNCFNFLTIAQKYAKFLPDYLRNKGRADIFRESWRRSMIPTDKLINQVVKIESRGTINSDAKKSGKELVCAHLRIGRSEYLPNDYVGLPLVSVPKVWDFIDEHFHNKSRIFVATDNLDVRKSAISKFGTRYIGSYAYTMNPDNMRSNLTLACSSQESAYVDQLLLSKCDVLIFYRRSGFSIHASYLKTKWRNIYSIMRNSSSTFSLQENNY